MLSTAEGVAFFAFMPIPKKTTDAPNDAPDTDRDTLVAGGGAIRVLDAAHRKLITDVPDGRVVIGGLGVVYDDPESEAKGDVDGLYFTRSTNLGPHKGNGVALTFNHTMPAFVKGRGEREQVRLDDFAQNLAEHAFGAIRTMETDKGLYFEALLDMADDYESFVADLARTGKLGASSATAGHLARLKLPDGRTAGFWEAIEAGGGEMLRWDIAEMAVTPIPAEPRTRGVMPLRSWQSPTIEVESEEALESGQGVHVHVHLHQDDSPSRFKFDPNPPDENTQQRPLPEEDSQTKRTMNEQLQRLIAAYKAADVATRTGLRTAILTMAPADAREDLDEAVRTAITEIENEKPGHVPTAQQQAPAQQGQPTGLTAEQVQAMIDNATRAQAPPSHQRPADPAIEASRGAYDGNYDGGANVNTLTGPELAKYENVDTVDLAVALACARSATRNRVTPDLPSQPSEQIYKAYALRMTSEESKKRENLVPAVRAWQHHAVRSGRFATEKDIAARANELHYSTQTDGGDEWIQQGYSSEIWEQVRHNAVMLQRLRVQEWNQSWGESVTFPIIDGDVTFYNVAQSTALSGTGGVPTGKVVSSKLNTGNRAFTLAKMGARSLWTGEMNEDSMVAFAATLRENVVTAGTEHMDSVLIDGDTALTASTNINDIAGTPAATDYFTAINGVRKLALVTNSDNARDAGSLTAADFQETRKLLGTAGLDGLDPQKISYLLDPLTYYKAVELPEVKTIDVVGQDATIRTGTLERIFGSEVVPAAHAHLVGSYTQGKLANTAGKIDQDTGSNNTTGSIIAIRWDQWKFFWRRMMQLETMRWPHADATEIVLYMRFSFNYRTTDAAAISYNVTV